MVSGGPACTAVGVLTWRRWGTFAVGKGIWVDDGDGVESGLGLRPIGREQGRTHWVAVLNGASKPTKSLQHALFCAKGAGWMERIVLLNRRFACSLTSFQIRNTAGIAFFGVFFVFPLPFDAVLASNNQSHPCRRLFISRHNRPHRHAIPLPAYVHLASSSYGGWNRRTRAPPPAANPHAPRHHQPLTSANAQPTPPKNQRGVGKAPQRRHLSTPTALHAGPPNTTPAHTRRARRPSSLPAQFGGDTRARRPIQTAIHPSRGAISAYAAPSAFSCDPHTYLRSFLNASAYTPGAIVCAGVMDLLAGRSGTTTALYRSLMHQTSVAGASQQWSTMDHHSRPTPEKGAPQTTLHDGRGGTRMGGAHNSGTNLTREWWRVSLSHHNTVSYLLGILQYAGFCGGETRSDGVWWALVDTCAPIAKSLNCLLFNEVPNHKNVEKAEKMVEKDLYCLVKQRPTPCSKMGNKTNYSGPKIERTNEDRNCGNKISNSASHSWEHVI
ncbi:hypothetical protein BJ912DRAFT_924738 [Pholiota molesta]|nr:hypothetical protein BJ912DRAFT_924738 [Pholiota molesta]